MKFKKFKKKKLKVNPQMFLLIVIAVIGGLAVLLSSNVLSLENPFNPDSNPNAGRRRAQTTQSYRDTFRDGVIDRVNWNVDDDGGVKVDESEQERLRMIIPEGVEETARLVFSERIQLGGDFAVRAEIPRAAVNGDGNGAVGVRFSAGIGGETAQIRREITSQGDDKLIFRVTDKNGNQLASETERISAGKITVLLERVNGRRYRAYYKIGVDDPNVGWKRVGTIASGDLGSAGNLVLFAHSRPNTRVRVNANFDDVLIRW